MVAQGTVAVNLGSGTTVAPGWINIDNSPNARLAKIPGVRRILNRIGMLSNAHLAVTWPDNLIVRDIRKPLPFGDGSVDYVYSSHTLEHLSREQTAGVLREVLRVLRPGGVVRIVLPNLRNAVENYSRAIAANPDDPHAAPALLESLHLSRGGRDPHLWMYDAPSLIALMQEIGFTEVAERPFQQGDVPDLDILDARDGSLHVEGTRP